MPRKIAVGLMVLATLAVGAYTYSLSRAQVAAPVAASPQTATVSPEAKDLLGKIRDAYASLKSLALTGSINGQFNIDGVQQNATGTFTGLFTSAGLFRSEMRETTSTNSPTTQPTGDALVGNSGDKVYLYFPQQNRYLMEDTPKGKIDLTALGSDIADLLQNQDLSLTLALSDDAAAQLSQDATAISRVDDVKIDNQSYPALLFTYPRFDRTVAVDPQTHLLRRVVSDVSRNSRLEGAKDVKSALLTTDYASQPNAPTDPSQFTWSPPPGAQLLASNDSNGANLVGKPIPSFSLPGLDGKTVSTDDLKGTVYVVDFWATWCPPCIASLPHIDAMYQDFKSQGVKFFAVNSAEDKDTVQKFLAGNKLSIPVLLDLDGKATDKFVADDGIPLIVVVGKDGVVVNAGFFGGDESQLRPIIDAALKK